MVKEGVELKGWMIEGRKESEERMDGEEKK